MATKQNNPTKIDPEVTWITIEEARRAWQFKTRSGFHWARTRGRVRARKSAGTWLMNVRDLVAWFGQPREPIKWDKKQDQV